jgi:hypothetical protein
VAGILVVKLSNESGILTLRSTELGSYDDIALDDK